MSTLVSVRTCKLTLRTLYYWVMWSSVNSSNPKKFFFWFFSSCWDEKWSGIVGFRCVCTSRVHPKQRCCCWSYSLRVPGRTEPGSETTNTRKLLHKDKVVLLIRSLLLLFFFLIGFVFSPPLPPPLSLHNHPPTINLLLTQRTSTVARVAQNVLASQYLSACCHFSSCNHAALLLLSEAPRLVCAAVK